MKTLSKYILIAVTCAGLSSCNKFLENEPISQVTPDDLFQTEQGAQSAVLGMYRTLLSAASYGQTNVIVPEFSAGHVNHVASFPEYVEFTNQTIRIDNPWIQSTWTSAYAAINAANNIIKFVDEMPAGAIQPEKKLQFVREAKFVRALNYFQLVRTFGDVPLILNPTAENDDLKVPRSAKADIYLQAISDLEEAQLLPAAYSNSAETKGRATASAAKALLAKVYLYQASISKDYTTSARLAKEVISSGFTLPADFASIWKAENTTEAIFELQFDEQATNNLAAVSNPNASVLFYAAGEAIADLFPEEDKRAAYTVYQNTATDSRFYIGKYRIFSPATQNLPLLRIAEQYLIHAEAQARVDGQISPAAYQSYKTVRDRAGLSTPTAAEIGSLDAFITAIQEEKRREMMFEGETWFDYCRTGLALTTIMKKADPNFYLYPIPDAERRNNPNLTQNPGY